MASSRCSLCAREFLQSSHEQLGWQKPRALKHTQYLSSNSPSEPVDRPSRQVADRALRTF